MLNKTIKRLVLCFMLVMMLVFVDSKSFLQAKSLGYEVIKAVIVYRAEQNMPEFNQYETAHFELKYKKEDEGVIKSIAQEFERSYEVLGQAYASGYGRNVPSEKTVVVVYPTQQIMWGYQKAIMGQAVMGVYQMGVIHVLSPNAYDMDSSRQMSYFLKDGPVLHEYTHKVIDDLTGGNVELWFTEGLALYEEYDKNGTEWAPDFVYNNYYTADELRFKFMDLNDEQAYRQSFDTVKILMDQYGKDKMAALLALLKDGNTLDEAFNIVYHMDVNDFIESIGKA